MEESRVREKSVREQQVRELHVRKWLVLAGATLKEPHVKGVCEEDVCHGGMHVRESCVKEPHVMELHVREWLVREINVCDCVCVSELHVR